MIPAAHPAAPIATATLWQAQQPSLPLPLPPPSQSVWGHAPLGLVTSGDQQAAAMVSPRAMMTVADLLEGGSGGATGGLSQLPPFHPQPLQPQPFNPKTRASPYADTAPMTAAGAPEVTSRFFTQRVAAGPPSPRQQMQMQMQMHPSAHSRLSPTPQPQATQAGPVIQLRPLLFSSHALPKLRPLLQFGQKQPGADRAPFPPPPISLSQHFSLRQSASIAADIVITGARSIALLVITDKEMQQAEQRKMFLQRSDWGN